MGLSFRIINDLDHALDTLIDRDGCMFISESTGATIANVSLDPAKDAVSTDA